LFTNTANEKARIILKFFTFSVFKNLGYLRKPVKEAIRMNKEGCDAQKIIEKKQSFRNILFGCAAKWSHLSGFARRRFGSRF
jgi:hypothetical protein